MAEPTQQPKFTTGDFVVDRAGNIGMVKAVIPYKYMGKLTTYVVTYGITGAWRKDAREDELTLYAPTEKL